MWGDSICTPSIFSKDLELQEDARKAAGACREALRRLIPPRLLGSEAFNHDHSDRGPPKMDSKVSHSHIKISGCLANVGGRTGAD